MARYASDPYAALDEFRDFVKESHRLGMEVYLDVVFNHTGEPAVAAGWHGGSGATHSA